MVEAEYNIMNLFRTRLLSRRTKKIKKEGGDRLWKAIVQGCAYCEGTESPRLIIVAQDKELSQQMWSKIRPLERWARLKIKDFSVDYFQYQYLVMMAKSSKD